MTKKKRSSSFILTLALIAVLGYMVITLVDLRVQIKDKRDLAEQTNRQYISQELKNEELKQVLDEKDKSKYIERVARDVLGYVLPGERVYYDISSGK